MGEAAVTASNVYELAAGVFIDHKRGPDPKGTVHACSWKANREGARRSAYGKVGRFLPPLPHSDFAAFPHGDDIAAGSPPPMRPLPPRRPRRHHQDRLEVSAR